MTKNEMADEKVAETKQASTMLLSHLHTPNPPCPPFTASFEHCRQWGEGGIVIFYAKKLINVALVDKQLTHVLNVWDQLGLKKQLATHPGNCCGSVSTLLDEKLMDTVTRSLLLVCVGRSHQSNHSLCSSTCGLFLA
jgi:hypothetical protein